MRKGRSLGPNGVAGRRRAGRVHARPRRLRRRQRRRPAAAAASEALQKLGKGEGEVNLISWAGYVEPEWSKPFEQKTGCKVNNKVAGTSDEMVQLMETGEYDGVSASGNASARLFAAGEVDPVNVDLVPNYKTVFSDLKDQPYNTFDGVNLRDPARSRRQPADVERRRRQAGADLLGRDPRPESRGQIQGQDQRSTTTRSTSPTRPST